MRTITMGIDGSKIRQEYLDDVQEYLVDNDVKKLLDELTPREFLKYWLEWQGVIGLDSKIVALMESLGWSLQGSQSELLPTELHG